jgi:hypothetical protein
MGFCHSPRAFALRPFIVATYSVDVRGEFVPEIPLVCLGGGNSGPAGSNGMESCSIGLHHRRSRKTGPGFPLFVVRCRTHGVAFTVYPPGHVPYGRVAVAPVDVGGRPLCAPVEPDRLASLPVRAGPDPAKEELARRPMAWGVTLFRAVEDAANGVSWPRSEGDGFEVWRTQRRRIALSAALLGLTEVHGKAAADPGLLGVPALTRLEAGAAYARAEGYRGRGRAVMPVLRELESCGARTLELVLAAGYSAGVWGRPRRWDPQGRRLRDVVVPTARSP